MHATSVDPNLSLWDRESLSHGVAEIFSTFLESLVEDGLYLRKKFGLSEEQVAQVQERRRFMELFFVAFYAANSLMKISFQEKMLTMDEASELYAKLYKDYLGFDIPGEYWQLPTVEHLPAHLWRIVARACHQSTIRLKHMLVYISVFLHNTMVAKSQLK